MPLARKTSFAAMRGSSMIEVVISLFLLAIGLLGVLAMQAGSVKSNQRAYLATEARLLASDMAERIMAYDDIDTADDDEDYDGIETPVSHSVDCVGNPCSRAEQVNYDSSEWSDQLSSRLPGGIGMVEHNGSIYTITVMWDNDLTGATGTGCSGDPEKDLTCYRLEMRL